MFANLSATNVVLNSLSVYTALFNAPAAVTALLASSGASAALFANPQAFTALFNSPSATATLLATNAAILTVLLGNDAAVDAAFAVSSIRLAFWNSDALISAMQANPGCIARLVNTGRATYGSAASVACTFTANGVKTILLRRWYGSMEHDYIQWSRSNGNASAPNGTSFYAVMAYERNTAYASNSTTPTTNTQGANLVLACNGLSRASWTYGNAMYVYYLVV